MLSRARARDIKSVCTPRGVVSAASLRPPFTTPAARSTSPCSSVTSSEGEAGSRPRNNHRTEARPELLGERADLRPGIERPLRRELGKAHLTRAAVAFPNSQRSFATETSFRLQVLLDPLAERQIRRTATGQDPCPA
jgi:hypothetical protein